MHKIPICFTNTHSSDIRIAVRVGMEQKLSVGFNFAKVNLSNRIQGRREGGFQGFQETP